MNAFRHLTVFGIIAACVVVFAAEQRIGRTLAEDYGAVPAIVVQSIGRLVQGEFDVSAARGLSRLVTALFLHGDVEHILYNMIFLWAFGYLTSEVLGQLWALFVFVVCGVCGNMVQVYLQPESWAQIIGASGAVCGLQGVYFGLALRWQLPWPAVWPLAHPIPPLQLGAFALAGFLVDVYFLANQGEHIAYGAHAGGFVAGVGIAAILSTVFPTDAAFERSRLKR